MDRFARKGRDQYSATAIGEAARPVVDREAVFAMSRGGQLIATSRDKGVRLWTREIKGSQTPWVAGDTRVRRGHDRQACRAHPQGWQSALGDGSARGWALERAGARGQPPLACFLERAACGGGRAFREPSPLQSDLGTPVMITPVIAEGRLYVLTDKAKLIAMN